MVDDAPIVSGQYLMGTEPEGRALLACTQSGWVSGVYEELEHGRRVRSWRGVPFGDSTADEGRFRAPKPARAWSGVKDCSAFGPVAPQTTYSWTDKVIGSEDCLNLDVVRPDTDDQLPVVVYLHGGSFFMGSSHMLLLRGFQLAQSMNVVYVSVNFRLGVLGYVDMSSLKGQACANPAMADQILALRWVRDNISAFGGDPANVTLMGESAGGAAVLALLASPPAAGLFHKAIAQSPPVTMVHSPVQSAFWARELVDKLALPRMSTVDDIRHQECGDMVRAGQSMMWRAGELMHLNPSFAPAVGDELLPEHPLEAFKRGHQQAVPLLIGTNSDEASLGKFLLQRQFSRQRAGLRLLNSFDRLGARRVVKAYNNSASRADFAELLADAIFWAPAVEIAGYHSRSAETYMYRFDFAPKALRMLGLGATHSLELSHIFGDPQASRLSVLLRLGATEDFDDLTRTMQKHWAEFIHQGRPGKQWKRYKAPQPRSTMIFDSHSHVESDPKHDKRQAWEGCDMQNWGAGRPALREDLEHILDDFD